MVIASFAGGAFTSPTKIVDAVKGAGADVFLGDVPDKRST
jgi:hypothetical protein